MIDKPTRLVVVKEIIIETPTVKRFVLAQSDGYPLAGFTPGSHITTFLDTNEGKMERNYSLCSDPNDTSSYEIAVRLTPNSTGGARNLHQAISVGDVITISQPKNHFTLSQRAAHHVLVAGGIGITPIYTMALSLHRLGSSFELHYAARSMAECAMYKTITRLASPTQFYFSSGHGTRRLRPEFVLEGQQIGTHLYLCGPTSLINEFRDAALSYGYPSDHIHYEHFQALCSNQNRSFLVQLKRSGRTLEIVQNETLLEGLSRHGVHVPHSCRIGGCGTCELLVCKGEIEHRDFYLSESERTANRTIISCVSRAKDNDIELDL